MSEQDQPPPGDDFPLSDAEAWTDYLAERPLPVQLSIIERLRRETASDTSTLMSVSPIIKGDPVLCLHVIRDAQQLHAAKGSDVTGIDHAIGSLGLERLRQLAERCTGLRPHPSRVAHLQYFRATANSHHAATQCAQWLRLRHATYAEKGWAAALCYGVGFWSLWMHAPLHMHRIICRIADDGLDPVQAEIETLGCTSQQISLGLAQRWQLPPLVIEALDHDTSPSLGTLEKLHRRTLSDPGLSREELRELSHLVQQHFFPVKLANWLALTTHRSWHGTRTLRMYDIVNDFLSRELPETAALIHRNCALSARQYHVPGILAPAAEMLLDASGSIAAARLGDRERGLYRGRFPAPPPPPAEKSDEVLPPTPDFLDAMAYQQILSRLLDGYELYTRPAHILRGLLLGLSEGLGLNRLALQVIQQQMLTTAQVIGIADDDPLAHSSVDLETSALLKQLCSRQTCIWINADTRERLLPMLPDSYRTALGSRDGLLASVLLKDKPVAVIYADLGTPDSPLTGFHRDHLRELCLAASQALRNMLTGG